MSVAESPAPEVVSAPAPAPVTVVPPVRSRVWGRVFVALLLLAVGGALGAAGMTVYDQQRTPAPVKPEEPAKEEPKSVTFAREKWESSGIRTETVVATPLADYAWRAGRVVTEDDRVAHVSPPVEGVVVEVRVRLGQDVQAGAVLAVLESREVGQAKLEYVRARLAVAAERERSGWAVSSAANMADLVKAVAADKPAVEIDGAFKDRHIGERRQNLMTAYAQRNQLRTQVASQKASSGVVPESTLRKTEAEAEAAEAALRALCEEYRYQSAQQARQSELKVKEAEAAFDGARTHLLTLGYTPAQIEATNPAAEGAAATRFELKAPFAGTIVERRGVRSERVGPQVEMFRLADLTAVWIQADAYEADLPLIRGLAGRPLMFRAPGCGIADRPAEIVYAGDLVDKASRAMTITAAAKNPERALKPGMYVEVGLPRGGPDPVLHVRASAIQRHQGKTFVFVHVKDDEFRRADVELGREGGDRVEVKSGLTAGDAVVVEGGFVLKSELFRDQLVGE